MSVFDKASKAAEAAVSVVLNQATLRSELTRRGLTVLSITDGKDGVDCEVSDRKGKRWAITIAFDGNVRTGVVAA
jgi:hypothetical protein